MSCTKLKIYYATGGGARHLSVKLSKQVQEYGDKYGYESLSISHSSYFITIRYNSTVLMQRDVIPAGNWTIQSIISYEWIGDDDSKFNPNAVEKPKPMVQIKEEKTATYTEKKDTVTLSDLTYQNLPQKLEQVAREWDEKWVGLNNETTEEQDKIWQIQKEKEQALAQVIKFVAIPSEKSDLFDLLLMAQTAFLSPTTEFYSAAAYYAKYQEALFKAKTLFANEDSFHAIVNNEQQVETQFKQIHKKQPKVGLKPSVKGWILWACGMSAFIVIGSILVTLRNAGII